MSRLTRCGEIEPNRFYAISRDRKCDASRRLLAGFSTRITSACRLLEQLIVVC